ncbi:MAG: glycine zipper 2TM domain-containing protein, partial [Gammaproteobacteria bacterium]|nr:glycine zipper 2TM domain-containing protein [Gammaproteobacteria bacterium]
MKKIFTFALCSLLALAIAGCDNMSKQDVGVLTGGTVGALVGSRFGKGSGQALGIALGAVGGALIGGAIGKNMDQTDQANVQRALENNRVGSTTTWHNPDTGNSYRVTPKKTYRSHGRYCREYLT